MLGGSGQLLHSAAQLASAYSLSVRDADLQTLKAELSDNVLGVASLPCRTE